MINKKLLLIILIVLCASGCRKYTCNDNYELIDGKCRTIVERKEMSFYYYCFDFDEQVDDKCIHTSIKQPGNLSCDKGTGTINNKCRNVTKTDQVCPDGYKLTDGKCIKTEIIDANKRYYCEEGYTQLDDACVKYEYK